MRRHVERAAVASEVEGNIEACLSSVPRMAANLSGPDRRVDPSTWVLSSLLERAYDPLPRSASTATFQASMVVGAPDRYALRLRSRGAGCVSSKSDGNRTRVSSERDAIP